MTVRGIEKIPFSGRASVSGTQNWEEGGIMPQSVGSSIRTRPDLNIDPAVADLPRGSGGIGHGIDVR